MAGGNDQGKGKGKLGAFFRRRPANWRSEEEGNPHRRGVTSSVRRGTQSTVGEGVGDDAVPRVVSTRRAAGRGDSRGASGSRSRLESDEDFVAHLEDYIGEHDDLPPESEVGTEEEAVQAQFVPMRSRRRGTFARSVVPSRGSGETASSSRGTKRSANDDTDWLVTQPMPGGPATPSQIPSYGGHIARDIWDGKERSGNPVIECLGRSKELRVIRDLAQKMSVQMRAFTLSSPLSSLMETMYDHIDQPLIAAFVERWQPDTNSFHLPVGEMTIMLHDVQHILGLPSLDGIMPTAVPMRDCVSFVEELFGASLETLRQRDVFANGAINNKALRAVITDSKYSLEVQSRAWHLLLLGNTLLVDKSKNKVRPQYWPSTQNVFEVSWGAVALAYLYRQLGEASRAETKKICGCLTLLQAWIYCYFPAFRPQQDTSITTPAARRWLPRAPIATVHQLRAYRQQLDKLTVWQVDWTPFGPRPYAKCPRTLYVGLIMAYDIVEPYMPDRVTRQLGHVQIIPADPIPPSAARRPRLSRLYTVSFDGANVNNAWKHYNRFCSLQMASLQSAGQVGETVPEYFDWFWKVSHPRVTRTQQGPTSGARPLSATDYYAWLQESISILTSVQKGGAQLPMPVRGDVDNFLSSWHRVVGSSATTGLDDEDDEEDEDDEVGEDDDDDDEDVQEEDDDYDDV